MPAELLRPELLALIILFLPALALMDLPLVPLALIAFPVGGHPCLSLWLPLPKRLLPSQFQRTQLLFAAHVLQLATHLFQTPPLALQKPHLLADVRLGKLALIRRCGGAGYNVGDGDRRSVGGGGCADPAADAERQQHKKDDPKGRSD